jgi:hypothetical protein
MKKRMFARYGLPATALALLLFACDRNDDLPTNGSSILPVRIHSLSILEGGSESLLRSQEAQETVSLPLSDGLFLEMTMKRDMPPLRAGQRKELAPGVLFRVIALDAGTSKYVSHGDFTAGSLSATVPKFFVESERTYDFVCLSYNNTTLPTAAGYVKGVNLPVLTINNRSDLLWWKKQSVTVYSDADAALDIDLNQMLVKVKVVLDCSYNGWMISGIAAGLSLGSIANTGTMKPATGEITPALLTQQLKWPSSKTSAMRQFSEQLTVLPKVSSALTVHIPVLTISREGLSAIPPVAANNKFTTPLQSGVSYTLRVRLRTPIWAGSNIYWEGDEKAGRLTFDPTGETQNEGFQGVFFKFGSLVGISPALVDGDDAFGTDLPLYVPDERATSQWSPTTAAAMQYASWYAIPHMDKSYYANSGRGRDDTSATDADQSIFASFRGDICRYRGEKEPTRLSDYRLPTSSEFGAVISWTRKGSFVTGDNSVATPFGQTNLLTAPLQLGYATHAKMDNVILPASGFRDLDGKLRATVGFDGYYWTASEYSAAEAWIFEYYGGTIIRPIRFLERDYAFPIRCVKN